MIPPATHARIAAIWTADPSLSIAAVQRQLQSESITAPSRVTMRGLRPVAAPTPPARDVEATQAMIRARAHELELLEADGLTLRHGWATAIAAALCERGHRITRQAVKSAWDNGLARPERSVLARSLK